ncbi:MAG: HepT-like ribonuclease domain-containing protein [Raoultibacter sp.]
MSGKTESTLARIVEYCKKIDDAKQRFFASRKQFDEDAFYRDGCAFYVQQIGELVKDLPESFIAGNPEVPWHQIRGFRNIIAHAYGSVDADVLWETITEDIPALASFCERILKD